MLDIFGPEGSAQLQALVRRRPLLAFDFDGTLAPIVPHPDDALVPAALSGLLALLAARAPVAIVTGRAVADVRQRLGFEPTYVVGNHGAEDPLLPTAPTITADAALSTLREHLGAQAAAALLAAGVALEDKQQSLALHYRAAPDHAAALRCIDAVLHDLDASLRRFGGKCVVNIVAAGTPDKADAVFSLVERSHSDAALFIGDDVNDETVFERAPPHWLTVRVSRDGPATRARFFIASQGEVGRLLERLLAALPERA